LPDNEIYISSLSFTAAKNPGKILEKRLHYSPETYTGYKTDAEGTIWHMTVNEDEIAGCIPYLYDKNLVPTIQCTSESIIQYSTDGGKNFEEWNVRR